MSRDNKNLATLQVRKPSPATVAHFIHGEEIGATPKVSEAVVIEAVPESGVTATPEPPAVAVVDANNESVETSVQRYEARGVLYQRTDGKTKRKRVAYLPLELDRELAGFCAVNGRKVSSTIALFIREGLQKHG